MSALVIRTLYNNQAWKARCSDPYHDRLCYYCPGNKLKLNIQKPSPGCDPCDGVCWEQILCKQYFWGCTPQGNFWGKAQLGMKVFFVHREVRDSGLPRLYTLWGKTTISSIADSINTSGLQSQNGYHLIYFAPFIVAPRSRQVTGLTANTITGKDWDQGGFRYILNNVAAMLDKLI